jgi:hypothetical protein
MTVDKIEKGAKSHRVPTRMCVACGRKTSPSELLRFIRNNCGELEFDGLCRKGGRGAYVCVGNPCFESALSKGAFSRALRGRVTGGQNAAMAIMRLRHE